MIMLQMIETHCVPLLTYALSVLHVSNRDERRSLRVAYNAVFRKIFGYKQYESVTALQHSLGRKTWEELTEKLRLNFISRAKQSNDQSLVKTLVQIIRPCD